MIKTQEFGVGGRNVVGFDGLGFGWFSVKLGFWCFSEGFGFNGLSVVDVGMGRIFGLLPLPLYFFGG